jgi:hypothetical protein
MQLCIFAGSTKCHRPGALGAYKRFKKQQRRVVGMTIDGVLPVSDATGAHKGIQTDRLQGQTLINCADGGVPTQRMPHGEVRPALSHISPPPPRCGVVRILKEW